MRVLWILNMVLPNVAKALEINTSFSGGWLVDLSNRIANDEEIEIATITYANVKEPICKKVNDIQNYIFPGAGKRLLFNNEKTADDINKVIRDFIPDLIHIHGTEYAMAYYIARDHKNIPTLLTIQGILTRISQEYYGGLSLKTILKISSLKNYLKLKAPIFAKALYKKNAKREQYVLKNVKYVTGRTDWDKSVMLSINQNLKYYRSNYNLREEFYDAPKWNINDIKRHTIYTGASPYSLKGLHILLNAVAIVKKNYPDVKVRVPGSAAKNGKLINPNDYEKFVLKEIKKLNIENNVEFIGRTNAKKVTDNLKGANICVVPSAMEGASATVCEAMMIGTPCICSYRGGMVSLLRDGESGFCYDFPEYSVLATRIMELFENDELCKQFSKNAMSDALVRHDRDVNYNTLKKIYIDVMENEKNV